MGASECDYAPDELVLSIAETLGEKIKRTALTLEDEARKGSQVCLLIGRSTRLTNQQKASLGVCAWATTLIFRDAVTALRGKDPEAVAAALDLDPDALAVTCIDLLRQAGMSATAARLWPILALAAEVEASEC